MAHFSSIRFLMPLAQGRGARARSLRQLPGTVPRLDSHLGPRRLPTLLAIVGAMLAGCAGAPVQEMSNARQAIRAARDAGAETMAPQKLNEAQVLLDRAEDSLERRAYREARRAAIAARDKAAEAMVAVKPDSNSG